MSDFVNSTSDNRTVNNVMRHEYRVLTDAEKSAMQTIKDKGLELWHANPADRSVSRSALPQLPPLWPCRWGIGA